MSIRIGSRIFAPRLFTTLLTIVLMALLISLGRWQLRRADHMPSPGIQLGTKAILAPPYPVVAAFPSRSEIARLLGESSWTAATDLMLLDPGEPGGYVRDWSPPGFPPLRHIGYAVQWFAMAATLLVIWVVTNLKRLGGGASAQSSDKTGVSK